MNTSQCSWGNKTNHENQSREKLQNQNKKITLNKSLRKESKAVKPQSYIFLNACQRRPKKKGQEESKNRTAEEPLPSMFKSTTDCEVINVLRWLRAELLYTVLRLKWKSDSRPQAGVPLHCSKPLFMEDAIWHKEGKGVWNGIVWSNIFQMHLRTTFRTVARCLCQAEQGHTVLLDPSDSILRYATDEVRPMKDAFVWNGAHMLTICAAFCTIWCFIHLLLWKPPKRHQHFVRSYSCCLAA